MSRIILPAGSPIFWGAATATSGQWLFLGGLENAATTAGENLARILSPRDAVIRNLRLLAGANTTVTVRINGVDTPLSVAGTTNVKAHDTTHSINVLAEDYITIGVTGTAGADCRVSVEFI